MKKIFLFLSVVMFAASPSFASLIELSDYGIEQTYNGKITFGNTNWYDSPESISNSFNFDFSSGKVSKSGYSDEIHTTNYGWCVHRLSDTFDKNYFTDLFFDCYPFGGYTCYPISAIEDNPYCVTYVPFGMCYDGSTMVINDEKVYPIYYFSFGFKDFDMTDPHRGLVLIEVIGLTRVQIEISKENAQKVLSSLIKKYGDNYISCERKLQNIFGETFYKKYKLWTGDDCTYVALSNNSNHDEYYLIYGSLDAYAYDVLLEESAHILNQQLMENELSQYNTVEL